MIYAGIYRIFNLITEKLYIGSSAKVKIRISKHKSDLRNNRHPNKYLQSSWNLHGEEAFIFEILELVNDINKLIEREQYWIDLTKCYDRNIGYNLNKIADRRTGMKQSDEHKLKLKLANTGRLFSAETKARMSKSAKGKPKSDEHKLKLSAAGLGHEAPNRNIEKWPCPKAARCKCDRCNLIKSKQLRERRYKNLTSLPKERKVYAIFRT